MGKWILCMLVILALTCQGTKVSAEEAIYQLYFHAQDGKLYYSENTGMNYFFNVQDLQYNIKEKSLLEIKNEAKKTYLLYFQMKPKASMCPDQLDFLKNITLSLTDEGGERLFDGTAAEIYPRGALASSSKSIDGLKEGMVFLGEFSPNEKKTIVATVLLSHNYWEDKGTIKLYYPMLESGEYAEKPQLQKPAGGRYKVVEQSAVRGESLIAETTWTFYAEEKTQEIPPEEPGDPKDPPEKPIDPEEPVEPKEPEEPTKEPEKPTKEPEKPTEPPLIPIEPAPKTGDRRAARYQILFLIAGAVLIILQLENREDRKDGKK